MASTYNASIGQGEIDSSLGIRTPGSVYLVTSRPENTLSQGTTWTAKDSECYPG